MRAHTSQPRVTLVWKKNKFKNCREDKLWKIIEMHNDVESFEKQTKNDLKTFLKTTTRRVKSFWWTIIFFVFFGTTPLVPSNTHSWLFFILNSFHFFNRAALCATWTSATCTSACHPDASDSGLAWPTLPPAHNTQWILKKTQRHGYRFVRQLGRLVRTVVVKATISASQVITVRARQTTQLAYLTPFWPTLEPALGDSRSGSCLTPLRVCHLPTLGSESAGERQ